VIAGIWFADSAKAQEKVGATKEQPTSFWMKKKLEYSQNILGGIANADFDKIVENAEAMRGLSKVEGFIRGQTLAIAPSFISSRSQPTKSFVKARRIMWTAPHSLLPSSRSVA
jgi:hypothetical protein